MEKNIYTVPTLKVLQFGSVHSFCVVSLKDIPEIEETEEAANEGIFDDYMDKNNQKSVWN